MKSGTPARYHTSFRPTSPYHADNIRDFVVSSRPLSLIVSGNHCRYCMKTTRMQFVLGGGYKSNPNLKSLDVCSIIMLHRVLEKTWKDRRDSFIEKIRRVCTEKVICVHLTLEIGRI